MMRTLTARRPGCAPELRTYLREIDEAAPLSRAEGRVLDAGSVLLEAEARLKRRTAGSSHTGNGAAS